VPAPKPKPKPKGKRKPEPVPEPDTESGPEIVFADAEDDLEDEYDANEDPAILHQLF
jgi:hypothetical protein